MKMSSTFVDQLSEAETAALHDCGGLRTHPAKSFLFHTQDPSTGVFVIESGLVRIERPQTDGRVALLTLAMQGQLVGELGVLDGTPRSATAQTLTTTRVRHVAADRFKELLLEHPRIQMVVLLGVVDRLRGLTTQFVETAMLDASARIAARLCQLVQYEHAVGSVNIDDEIIDLRLPISQEELGEWSGLAREGAAKGLATLRSIGVIETGRMRVRILDLERLQAHAASS